MTTTLRFSLRLSLAAAIIAAAVPAHAQSPAVDQDRVLYVPPATATPLVELSGGYTIVRDSGRSVTLPKAWLTGLSVWVQPKMAVVAEVDGAYHARSTAEGKREYRTHAFMAGVRAPIPRWESNRVFLQALVGTSCYCGSTAQTDGKFTRGLALQAGVGTDVPVLPGLAARLQGDYRRVNGDGIGFNQFRVAASAVVRVGRSQ